MKILLTNDDGYGANGLQILEKVAQKFGEVSIVAPKSEKSQAGHALTFHKVIEVQEVKKKHFIVDGSPADCVRLGNYYLTKHPFDLILSGVNRGSNFGYDMFVSGTVSAVREASFYNLKAVAISQYYNTHSGKVDWDISEKLTNKAMEWLFSKSDFFTKKINYHHYWNINLPCSISTKATDIADKRIIFTHPSQDIIPVKFRFVPEKKGYIDDGDYHARKIGKDSDVDIVENGDISVSKIKVTPS